MRAMVLCAGRGTRLHPITESLPKPLVRMAGCTLLEDVLFHLAGQGVDSVVVNGSWMAGRLEKWLENTDLPLEVAFQREESPLGTAGAVRRALPRLGDRFLVVYGDNLTRQPVAPLIALHESLDAEVTIALSPTGKPSSKGIVLTDPQGRITDFREKPPEEIAESNLANSGIYVCNSSAVEEIEDGKFMDFGSTLFPSMLSSGRTLAADTPGGYTRDVGTPEDYLLACYDVLSGRVMPYRPNPDPVPEVLIENGQPADEVEVHGTLWLQEGSKVEGGCCLENCVVLSGARVGEGCRLRNTLVMPGSSVPADTVEDDKYLNIF